MALLGGVTGYEIPSGIYVLPRTLGMSIRQTARSLAESGEQAEQHALLYAEKQGGFSCGTCLYATPVNQTHGRCKIMEGIIHLEQGCCAAWDADPKQLHLYREPKSESLP